MDVIAGLTRGLADGSVEVVDLSRPVGPDLPASSWLARGLTDGAIIGEALVIEGHQLTIGDVLAFQAQHGVALDGSWVILRSGPQASFDAECLRWLAHDTRALGVGAGSSNLDADELIAAGKHGLAGLTNLEALSPTGSVLIAAQLRVLALVPQPAGA